MTDDERRMLALLAASDDGCTEAILLAHEHACKLGLEGIVCKRPDSAYRSGRSKSWLKVKNPASPAMRRMEEG